MSNRMNAQENEVAARRWELYLTECDREIARLATLCQVRILDPGVIERVLHKDESVCGKSNDISFTELRDTVAFDLAVLRKVTGRIGRIPIAQIENYLVQRLKNSFPALAAPWVAV